MIILLLFTNYLIRRLGNLTLPSLYYTAQPFSTYSYLYSLNVYCI